MKKNKQNKKNKDNLIEQSVQENATLQQEDNSQTPIEEFDNNFDDLALFNSDNFDDDLLENYEMQQDSIEQENNDNSLIENKSVIVADSNAGEIENLQPLQDNDLEQENKPIKVREIAVQSTATRVNKFDLFFLRLWSGIVAMIGYCADGINFVINLIFKRKLPKKYLKAFVSVLLIVLLLLLIILPITANTEKKNDDGLVIFEHNLAPVKIIASYDENDQPIYKWGYVDKNKAPDGAAKESLKIPALYEEALPFCKYGVAWVRVKNNDGHFWQLINTKGKRISKKIYRVNSSMPITEKPFGDFSDNKLCWVYDSVGGKYGYINTNGDVKIECTYDVASDFVDGIARVGRGNKEWFINAKEKQIGRYNEYEKVQDFSCGLGAVKREKWGFINAKGVEVIDLKYDAVSQFVDGYAMVKMGNTFGLIDTKGNSIVGTSEYYEILINNPIFKEFVEQNK